jgi:drug/metabolite transporter (DMT)-like permease
VARLERDLREAEAYGLLLSVSIIWAGNFLAGKVALRVIGPITLAALRASLASALLLWYLRLSYSTWPVAGMADVRVFAILALTGLVSSTTLWYYGLRATLAVNAAILGAMGPVFVALLSVAWLRERLSPLNWLGIGLSSAGVILTIIRGSLQALLDLDLHAGDLFVLAGQVSWAAYSVYSRQLAQRFAPAVVITGSYLVSTAILVPLALVERPWTALGQVTPGTVLAVLYAALLVTLSHIWFYWGMRVVSAPVASLTANLIPFEVVALSWLFLDEAVTWLHIAGALIVIAGVALATRKT